MTSPRICSLLPSATEIVCCLGLQDHLVGITHECDFPPEVSSLPTVTESVVDMLGMASKDIDVAIRESLRNLSTIYQLDRDRLAAISPDLILTQELCEVCAVSFDRVQEAAADICPTAEILSLEPQTLQGILESIQLVACRTGVGERGLEVVQGLQSRINTIRRRLSDVDRKPKVLTLEWLDPLFVGGHWVPDMVEAAGGVDVFAEPATRSREIDWSEVFEKQPDVIVVMPCGFDLNRTLAESSKIEWPLEMNQVPAVLKGQVFAVDGSAYFNRPGPRIVDGVEILATVLHPEVFGDINKGMAVRVSV